MENEFGYIDDKPFKQCYPDKQMIAIIKTSENGIEFKVNDITKYDFYDYKSQKREIYGVDSCLKPITALNIKLMKTEYSAISSSILQSNFYVYGYKGNDNICHFTVKTKISKIEYYHPDLRNIFGNASYNASIKFRKDDSVKSIKIEAKRLQQKTIGNIIMNQNKMYIKLDSNFEFTEECDSYREIKIKDKSKIIINFKKAIDIQEVYKLVKMLDSTIHLLMLTRKRHNKIDIYDYKKNVYYLRDKRISEEISRNKKDKYLVCRKDETAKNFIQILKVLYELDENSKNIIFPFLEYDRKGTLLEIQFLEYYRTLEYLEKERNKRENKGKNNTFLFNILKEYKEVKEKFFEDQTDNEIEEEIRSLRNYYSHEGYYIDKLPIPTNNSKRYKTVEVKWLSRVKKFVEIVTYLEMYKLCGVNIKNNIIYQL